MKKTGESNQETKSGISGAPPAAWVWFAWMAVVFFLYFKQFVP